MSKKNKTGNGGNHQQQPQPSSTNFSTKETANFRNSRTELLSTLYSDDTSTGNRYDRKVSERVKDKATAKEVRKAINEAARTGNRQDIVNASNRLYTTNPIYMSVINYLRDMFTWDYIVIPHKLYTPSRIKAKKKPKIDDYRVILNLMQEVTDGLVVETKFPTVLTKMFLNGVVFLTTICDEDSISIDTIILPDKYCRKIGESQFGSSIIEFDFSYFDALGLTEKELEDYLSTWTEEFRQGYKEYKENSLDSRWIQLDARFSTCVQLNEKSIPTYYYLYGGILDYEKYQDNELERNENLLKYIVVHTIPHYEDKLIFEIDEVKALHNSLKKIVDTGERARLITTYGDVHVDRISENDTSENQVLSKAFKSIFNNAGFNSGIFTSESVEALKMSLVRDKEMVWHYVQQLVNFYNITINNWFDFQGYQADFEILKVSPYTYNDDMETLKTNATLGVGKLIYVVASGVKQKNIQDTAVLEDFLGFDDIRPMQTSYTQTAEDRNEDTKNKKDEKEVNNNNNNKDNQQEANNETSSKEDNLKSKDSSDNASEPAKEENEDFSKFFIKH